MGRGFGQPHAASTAEHVVPIVAMDYFFIIVEGVQRRGELSVIDEAIAEGWIAGTITKCLAVRCLDTKNMFAHVAPQKGKDEEQRLGRKGK